MLSFTPVFMILTGALVLDEMPNAWGLFGIVIICVGGYILNLAARIIGTLLMVAGTGVITIWGR